MRYRYRTLPREGHRSRLVRTPRLRRGLGNLFFLTGTNPGKRPIRATLVINKTAYKLNDSRPTRTKQRRQSALALMATCVLGLAGIAAGVLALAGLSRSDAGTILGDKTGRTTASVTASEQGDPHFAVDATRAPVGRDAGNDGRNRSQMTRSQVADSGASSYPFATLSTIHATTENTGVNVSLWDHDRVAATASPVAADHVFDDSFNGIGIGDNSPLTMLNYSDRIIERLAK